MIRRGRRPLKRALHALLGGLALCAAPVSAQDEVVDTGMRIATGNSLSPVALAPPVVGLRRQADSAVRTIEIVSDSREDDMRRSEVAAMLRAAIERAARDGVTLVTGEYELVEVTRDNWQDQFPGLAGSDEQAADEDDDDYDDYDDEDDGSTLRVRLKVKTSLDGSVDNAQRKITAFVRTVPVTGRSQIEQRGGLALTIIKPEQYRDAIYGRIAEAAKAALAFYGADYGLEVTGLDSAIEWQQVSNTEVFLFIRYHFTVRK
jgi:hypothetical protein